MKNICSLRLILIIMLLISCSKGKKESNSHADLHPQADYSNVVLTIKRGAFHYDKFVLQDTTITFYPSDKTFIADHKKYNRISRQEITPSDKKEFMDKIVEDGIFRMDSLYTNSTTDNSSLTVILEQDDKKKQLKCIDFKRGCPELLQFIENTMVKLHGHHLKRILLPG